ncbi:MAG: hypothetical protein QOK07_3183 [Gemmatimonadaceae bacterium]|nr:hypothetical protein [Gemmatimonadaceae bacterium]
MAAPALLALHACVRLSELYSDHSSIQVISQPRGHVELLQDVDRACSLVGRRGRFRFHLYG